MIIKRDKFQHFIVSCALVIVIHKIAGIWWALALALVWAFGKEWYDDTHDGIFSWKDIIADLLGIGFGILLAWGIT